MEAGTLCEAETSSPTLHGSPELTRNNTLEQLDEINLDDTHNPWETARNKRLDAEHTKESSKEGTRQRLLDCVLASNDKALDLMAMCVKYRIPVRVHGEHGDAYERTEPELRRDVKAALEAEREKAWCTVHQAEKQLAEPFMRTLSRAEGISQSSKFISISYEDLVPVAQGWGPSLCGMFAGRFPGKSAVIGLTNRWRVPVKVAYHRKGWMVFSFRYAKDMERVLSMGPQAIFGIPLILEPLSEDFNFNKKLQVNIPVWIRIPDLPLSLWSRSAIEKIATVTGTPVMVDEATILKHSIDGPRVQIIINILDEIRKDVEIVMPDGSEFV